MIARPFGGPAMSSATTFWRLAGMTYLQYVNTASATVRGVLKESVKTKALARDTVFFHHISQSGVKTPVNSLAEVSAMK